MLTDLILGTAGHIDHGKTSLILALTGTNTDRLPEEKKRGITIELGYAQLDLPPFRVGIVDVPGHEKFVRQMLAGATGMDLALLVIAADDSINQQTREHLDILRMLDLTAGLIALTKCDLVDPSWLELVEDEIQQLVAGTFLETAPIIRTSCKTGQGIEELKEAIKVACQTAATILDQNIAPTKNSNQPTPFRLAIDRAFSIAGHGTVVTGSVSSGQLNVGDQIEIQPGGVSARVRGLHQHDHSTDVVHRGQRAAINLAGVSLQDIERGHEISSLGHLVPSKRLTVQLNLLDRADKPLKDRAHVRVHLGTAELFGQVRLLDANELSPGHSAFAQIHLSQPAVSIWNQPFVIRRESPVETIGGGRVLDPDAARIRKPTANDLAMLKDWSSDQPLRRAAAAIYFSDLKTWQPSQLSRSAGVVDIDSILVELIDAGELIDVPISTTRRVLLHRLHLEEMSDRMLKVLARLHREFPLRFSHPRSVVEVEFSYLGQQELVSQIVDRLKQQKKIIANVNSIGITGYGPKLSKGQKQLLEQLIEQFRVQGLQAPAVSDLESGARKNKDSVSDLLEMASENGDLVKVSSDLFLHADTMRETQGKLAAAIKNSPSQGLTVSEIRQVLNTTRKYAVPLCEYLDRIGFTKRDGDLRVLGSSPAGKPGT